MTTNTEFSQFLESLGAFESGINPTKDYGPNDLNWLMVFDSNKGNVDRNSVDLTNAEDLAMLQYHVHNTLGFLGKYQFGEPLLIDLGYYLPAPTGYYGSTATNEWQGTFTGKNGVYSKEDFMSNAQELAIREAFAMNMSIIEARLAQAGKTIDDFLGQPFTFTFGGEVKEGVISVSGILASAHLQGPGGVANLLLNGVVSHDEYGTNILSYMGEFGGYDTPFGTAGDDALVGSDYTETFSGSSGNDVITTGGGHDKIVINQAANSLDIIKDFDIANDVISLMKLNGLMFGDLLINNNAEGNAQINLANNQKIIFEGVDAAQLTASNFVQGNVVLGWNYNGGDKHIENFNLQHDLIDFNYAFGLNNVNLYEQNGNAVIDIVDNNQRYILDGISLNQLSAFNFIKAPVGFAEAFFGDSAPPPPPPPVGEEEDPVENPSDEEDNDTPGDVVDGEQGVYAFTWNWGSHVIIQDFDVAHDIINLESFWASYAGFDLYNDANGNAVIDLTNINNQTITLKDISVAELSTSNFIGVGGQYPGAVIPPPVGDPVDDDPVDEGGDVEPPADQQVYSYTWQWGNKAVISDFDITQDVIDLQGFWANYNSFDIYNNSEGNAVIDLTALNNQTITLAGIGAEELSANNFRGVSGHLGDALNLGLNQPPANEEEPDDESPAELGHEVFSFTWAWGSRDIVHGFDVGHDAVDLRSFWITPDRVAIYNNPEGDVVIDLTGVNNQTITIEGVSVDQLHGDSVVF